MKSAQTLWGETMIVRGTHEAAGLLIGENQQTAQFSFTRKPAACCYEKPLGPHKR